MVTTPFKLEGVFSYPPDDGEPAADRSFALAGMFQHKTELDLVLTGSGTSSVGFGSLASGAKAIFVEVDPVAPGDTEAPINVQVNGAGATGQVEVSQGGFWVLGSPKPTASGVLSLDITHTQNARVKVKVLG